ncbi:uncharacterized protein FMAN_13318 [Fusarium mangiferae]|uniref:Uncharacterized protein n=1 Tax=Fusarium mangiferae TaxID=192010 RepID=A0A1L7TJY3_FUSMA|nr:uncharacterized protein FMAN_13318 [Fusarium mangiferae]CVK95106.1 uncharacterized protein FMAN_13318 [Fusarium mangiferae]
MSSHRNGKGSNKPRSNDQKPSGTRSINPGSTDPGFNGPKSDRPRPNGPRTMELGTPGPRNVDLESMEPRLSGQRTMGPRSNDPRSTSDHPQTGASGAGGQKQIVIMRLSEELAKIRWRIEAIYPLKAEQQEAVECQSDKIAWMEREKRSSKDKRKAKEELEVMEATLKETVKKLEKARLEEEEVFMKRWRLQHGK